MTVALVMIARDEATLIGKALGSVKPLVDTWTVVDTGSVDNTIDLVNQTLEGVPGQLLEREWAGHADARTAALEAARGTADWLLMMDADMEAEVHPDLRSWLAADPDPDVAIWRVEIEDHGLKWRLPWLTRGDRLWRYEGEAHAMLACEGKQRSLLGLTLRHLGGYQSTRWQENVEALAAGVASGDPRSVYYTAWALKALGRLEQAAELFDVRAGLPGWEEEAWHAQYMAALLRQDVDGLMAAHRRRPWRHEPLTQAARIIAGIPHDDILFMEQHG